MTYEKGYVVNLNGREIFCKDIKSLARLTGYNYTYMKDSVNYQSRNFKKLPGLKSIEVWKDSKLVRVVVNKGFNKTVMEVIPND